MNSIKDSSIHPQVKNSGGFIRGHHYPQGETETRTKNSNTPATMKPFPKRKEQKTSMIQIPLLARALANDLIF